MENQNIRIHLKAYDNKILDLSTEEIVNTAQYYTERMIDYVCNNTSSFPEYSTNSGADVTPDRNAYYNGMNLERPSGQGTKLTLRNFLSAGD